MKMEIMEDTMRPPFYGVQIRADGRWVYVAKLSEQIPGTVCTTDDPDKIASALDIDHFRRRDCVHFYRPRLVVEGQIPPIFPDEVTEDMMDIPADANGAQPTPSTYRRVSTPDGGQHDHN